MDNRKTKEISAELLKEITDNDLKEEIASSIIGSNVPTRDSYNLNLPDDISTFLQEKINNLNSLVCGNVISERLHDAFSFSLSRIEAAEKRKPKVHLKADSSRHLCESLDRLLKSEKEMAFILSQLNLKPKEDKKPDLLQLIRSDNKYELMHRLNNMNIMHTLDQYPTDAFYIGFAFKLMDIVEEGYPKYLDWLEAVCSRCCGNSDSSKILSTKLKSLQDPRFASCLNILKR